MYLPGLLLTAGMFFLSCNDNSKSTTTSSADSTANQDRMATNNPPAATVENADQETINYAVEKNTKEMMWLQAGIDRGTSKELKDHARMMLADHKKLDGEVKALAGSKNWQLPTVDTANVVDLNKDAGNDWDKAWTDKMVDEHEDLLSKLKDSETDVKDADLKALVTKTIPVVQGHLDMAKKMKDKMK